VKIIIDVNLSPDWVAVLRNAGHEAVHWSEIGPQNADDEEIVVRAERDGAMIMTRDLDFGAYLVLAGRTRPSVIQVRAKRTSADRYADLVLKALHQTRFELEQGALVTVDFERVRVRLLTHPSNEQ
jgi:predicted nuclease of predicted toxin-antitoxin system